jgi:hypothetical protein
VIRPISWAWQVLNKFADQENKWRRTMITKSKIAVVAAIAALSIASPALAQSFNGSNGTGNELPSYYDQNGGLHAGIAPQHDQIVAGRSGLNAFASVVRGVSNSDSPAATGGGSVGYNEMLRDDQW